MSIYHHSVCVCVKNEQIDKELHHRDRERGFQEDKAKVLLQNRKKHSSEKVENDIKEWIHVWHCFTIMILFSFDECVVVCKTADGGCGCLGKSVAGMGFVVVTIVDVGATWTGFKPSWILLGTKFFATVTLWVRLAWILGGATLYSTTSSLTTWKMIKEHWILILIALTKELTRCRAHSLKSSLAEELTRWRAHSLKSSLAEELTRCKAHSL